jgi:hypothetical protein
MTMNLRTSLLVPWCLWAGSTLAACAPEPGAPLHDSAAAKEAGADDARRPGNPRNTAPPTVSGDPTVGSALTVDVGSWSGAAPLTTSVRWRRCDEAGLACVNIAGATSDTYTITGEDVLHTLSARVTATNAIGTRRRVTTPVATSFPAGTVCDTSGGAWSAPATLEHVIVILMENRDASEVAGNSAAPYFTDVRDLCGSSSGYMDNLFTWDINSLSHYLALTSGSNCNSGLGSTGSGCVTDDNGPSSHQLTTESIFEHADSWRAYQEDMPSNCDSGNPASGTAYYVKHNPPAYYTRLASECATEDVGMPTVSCPGTVGGVCSTPTGAFADDLADDTLAQYSFVTPDIDNDMHDGSVTEGDNWLHTYLPLILASPAYLRGGTAVYVLWDEEAGAFANGPIPNLFVSPFVQPQIATATMNHFAALRAMEDQLGLTTHLGCASGTKPGGGACPSGSTADLRAIFGF